MNWILEGLTTRQDWSTIEPAEAVWVRPIRSPIFVGGKAWFKIGYLKIRDQVGVSEEAVLLQSRRKTLARESNEQAE